MPKLTRSQPKYRRHNVRNIAFVAIGGKRHYLPGAYGSKESREAYLKKMLLWERTGRPSVNEPLPDELSIAELLVAFLAFAERHYVKNGRQTDEVCGIKLAIKPLYEMYLNLPARRVQKRNRIQSHLKIRRYQKISKSISAEGR